MSMFLYTVVPGFLNGLSMFAREGGEGEGQAG